MPGRLPKQFVQVVAVGLQRFGKTLLDDDAFLVRVHCFATAAGAGDPADLSGPLLNERRKPCGDFDGLVGTHLERGADPVRIVVRFHKAEGDVADFLERFYLSRLSLSEEKRPEIAKIMAENAVRERDYEKALELISLRWRDFKDDPQIHYWKAWALFALGKDAPAIKQLEMMISVCPDP
jgi:tetratricopeptide (TPR) repeat protein